MTLQELLALARDGVLPACDGCPWSPRRDRSVGFGVSCTDHGVRWESESQANSMLIVQDPADTTPHETGRLCAVHNSMNPSDRTAQQSLALWNAAVSLQAEEPNAGGYLRRHYWTNSIMHGASGSTGLRASKIMARARQHCLRVLEAQIRLLRPNVIIATGKAAVDSLRELRLIPVDWSKARQIFSDGAYHHRNAEWIADKTVRVFCTYHTAARVVNQTLAKMYDPSHTEDLILKKSRAIHSPPSVEQFLRRYGEPDKRSADRGMRYLLNHWLDIGLAIRAAGQSDAV